MKIPKLPTAVVSVLGVLAFILAAVEPQLEGPWRAVVAGVIGVCVLLGVPATTRSVTRHGEDAYQRGLVEPPPVPPDRRPSAMDDQGFTVSHRSTDPGPDSGSKRRLQAGLLALVVLATLGAGSPAGLRWWPLHDQHRPSTAIAVTVPVITDAHRTCDGGVVLTIVQRDVGVDGSILAQRATADGVVAEGLLLGAWHITQAADDGHGHLTVADVPYGFWRASLAAGWGHAVGPGFLALAPDQPCPASI